MRLSQIGATTRWSAMLALAVLPGSMACSIDTLLNNTASLGGDTAGQRGQVRVSFVNHTPFRAIFTYGTYDPQDPNQASTDFKPQFRQFFNDATAANRLEGNSESSVVTFNCARAVSLGGEEFIQRLRDADVVKDASQDALVTGIGFSDKPLDDPQAGEATAGRAPAVQTLQGAEFQCGSLLIYTFELDDTQPSGFRVDLQVVLP